MSVLIQPSAGSQGEGFFLNGIGSTTPGTEQTLISTTLAFDIELMLAQVRCNMEGTFKIFVAGSLIGSGRTGPGNRNPSHYWLPSKNADSGDLLELKFTAFLQTAIVPIEAFISAVKI